MSDANILIVQKIPDNQKWADVLVNLKYKYFKAKISEGGKMLINIFKQHKNLVIYFENESEIKAVFDTINENKTTVLLRELSFFSDKLHTVRSIIAKNQNS